MTNCKHLIVGGGMTAAAAVDGIREVDSSDEISLIGAELDIRNNLQRYLRQASPLSDAAARRTLERWHLHGGLIYFHLLLDRLSKEGLLPSEAA
jgi:hypothetical protein